MDRDAFADLVQRHQPTVSRFVARYLRRREDQDEVVQDTFLRAWAQIGRFQADTNFAAWVLTIARFLCMARMKDAQRHPTPATLEPHLEPEAPPLPENLEKLKHAVARLPISQREVVAMRFFDGLDYRAIAEITGDSEVTLRSRLHDALEKLKVQLATPKQ
jgi:RNA polymerase sigma-70 factor (ECF subfamily)